MSGCARSAQRKVCHSGKQAAKTGLSHGTIDDIIKGGGASAETIRKLAQGFSGSGDHQRLALEDELLVLAGYRTRRPEGQEPGQPLARLMDIIGKFSESQLKIMSRFAEFIAERQRDDTNRRRQEVKEVK